MKKIVIVLMACSLILTSCGGKDITNDNIQVEATDNKLDLSKETEEYKKFVEEQIDMLLKDSEKFAEVLKSGNLEEAKKMYPLIRMAYERSEPIAESFGESDVNIDFRLVDFKEEYNTDKGTEKYAIQLIDDIKELAAKIKTVEVTPVSITGRVGSIGYSSCTCF